MFSLSSLVNNLQHFFPFTVLLAAIPVSSADKVAAQDQTHLHPKNDVEPQAIRKFTPQNRLVATSTNESTSLCHGLSAVLQFSRRKPRNTATMTSKILETLTKIKITTTKEITENVIITETTTTKVDPSRRGTTTKIGDLTPQRKTAIGPGNTAATGTEIAQ
jgi:hypothetical protein